MMRSLTTVGGEQIRSNSNEYALGGRTSSMTKLSPRSFARAMSGNICPVYDVPPIRRYRNTPEHVIKKGFSTGLPVLDLAQGPTRALQINVERFGVLSEICPGIRDRIH